jgi:hypothetical protein
MNSPANILCFLATYTLASAQNEVPWAYVPSPREARAIGVMVRGYVPSEADVRVVGSAPQPAALAPDLRPVFAVEMPVQGDALAEKATKGDYGIPAVPEGTRWPDSSDRIVAVLPPPAGNPISSKIRNPWQVRIHPRSPGSEVNFQCGGVILGGEGGSIAFLNGRAVRKGDNLGKFRVASVLALGVVVERVGLYFMIPLRRSATISIVEG